MTTALILLALAGGLLALANWGIRRTNPAAAPAAAFRPQPVGAGCEIGQVLLMASATEVSTGGGTAGDSGGGAPSRPKRRKPSGPSRRAFLRGSMGFAWLGVLGGFGASTLAFLWPNLRGGFGATLDVESEEEILAYINENNEPFPYPQGRAYFVAYSQENDPTGAYAELTNNASVMALYQVCVHLGCKVPWCLSSQWFECPCHGSRYNRWGEYRGGPAPRGLDRFSVEIVDGRVMLDTATIITGPSRNAVVLDQPQEGPSCL